MQPDAPDDPLSGVALPPPRPAVKSTLRPSKRWWATLISSVIASICLTLLRKYTGIDPQPLLDTAWIFASQFLDIGDPPSAVAGLSFLIAMAISYLVKPSAQDIIDRITNDLIRFANVQKSDVTAVIVDEHTSEQAARIDVALGIVPPPSSPPPEKGT